MSGKVALVTGVTGQDGSFLSELLLEKGYEVYGLQRRTSGVSTYRIDHILETAPAPGKIQTMYGDLADANSIVRLLLQIKPDEVYNLGAMSHVRISFDVPEYTMQVVGVAPVRILEALRTIGAKNTKYYQSSSSEMFGTSPPPQNETTPMMPVSPYGCAKLAAYHLTRAYRTGYKMFACNGILFNHETMAGCMPMFTKQAGVDGFDIKPLEDIVTVVDRSHPVYQAAAVSGLSVWGKSGWVDVKFASAYPHNISGDNKRPRIVNGRCGAYFATGSHVAFLEGREVATRDIQVGDKFDIVKLPVTEHTTQDISVEEAELIGMLVADGSASRRPRGIGIHGKFTKNAERLLSRFTYLWQTVTKGQVVKQQTPSGFTAGHTVTQLRLNGASDWLRRLDLYTTARKKRIPHRVLNASSSAQLAFLRGYNNCDGLKLNPCTYEFKSWKTNSPTLAAGLWYLADKLLADQDKNLSVEYDQRKIPYYSINLLSPTAGNSGKHFKKPFPEIKKIIDIPEYDGWFYDLETSSGEFVSGIGNIHVHNSPRRGQNFVTRKIVQAAVNIALGTQRDIHLGNLTAKRDWGFAGDYVRSMWMIMQHPLPDDFVIGTREQHSVREFAERVFAHLGLIFDEYLVNDDQYRRPTEVPSLLADPTKAESVLGWKPEVSFDQLIEMMVKHDYDLAKCKNGAGAHQRWY